MIYEYLCLDTSKTHFLQSEIFIITTLEPGPDPDHNATLFKSPLPLFWRQCGPPKIGWITRCQEATQGMKT